MKYIVVILVLSTIGFIWYSNTYLPPLGDEVPKFYILGGRYRYEVKQFTEENGCVTFNGYFNKITKICGNYTIGRY